MACYIIRYKQLRNGILHSQVTGGGYQSIRDVACLYTVLLSSKQRSDFIYMQKDYPRSSARRKIRYYLLT